MLRAALLGVWAAAGVHGFGFHVEPHATECFEEHASASDHVQGSWTLSAESVAAGHLEGWKVEVTSPSGDAVYKSMAEHEDQFNYYATSEGIYKVCFLNRRPAPAEVTATIEVGEPPDLIQLAKTEHLTPIEERIKNVSTSPPSRHPPPRRTSAPQA